MAENTIATAYVQIKPTTKGITPEIEDELTKSGDKGGGKFSAAFSAALKAGGAAIAAAATGIGKIVSESVQSYANYEQLVGGVETLFGDSAKFIAKFADEAYMNAGISASEYMEQATGLAAAMINSMNGDTAGAAAWVNAAIKDMADNANKMGTSLESIQNAYAGFAKGNFTMLDNLKLGYGGTASEMIRLINDSQILEEEITSLDGIGLNIIAEAIHEVQANMGLLGVTATEAKETISGSAGAMKAAWGNMLVAIADDNADFGAQINALATTASTFVSLLVPRISQALQGIGQIVTQIAPVIMAELPNLIETLLPPLLSAALLLVTQVIQMLPDLFDAGIEILGQLIDQIIASLPLLLAVIPELVLTVVDSLLENIPMLIDAGIQLMTSLIEDLPTIINNIVSKLPEIIVNIINALLGQLPLLIKAGVDLLVALIHDLPTIIDTIIAALPEIIDAIVTALIDGLPLLIQAGFDLFMALIEELPTFLGQLAIAVFDIITALVDSFTEHWDDIKSVGANLLNGIWSGIQGSVTAFINNIKSIWTRVVDSAKQAFAIHSPSRIFRDVIGENLMLGMAEGITGNTDAVTDAIDDVGELTTGQMEASLGVSAALGTTGAAEANNRLDVLIGAVVALTEKVDNMEIYLDGKTLVGGIANEIDSALSHKGMAVARGY